MQQLYGGLIIVRGTGSWFCCLRCSHLNSPDACSRYELSPHSSEQLCKGSTCRRRASLQYEFVGDGSSGECKRRSAYSHISDSCTLLPCFSGSRSRESWNTLRIREGDCKPGRMSSFLKSAVNQCQSYQTESYNISMKHQTMSVTVRVVWKLILSSPLIPSLPFTLIILLLPSHPPPCSRHSRQLETPIHANPLIHSHHPKSSHSR